VCMAYAVIIAMARVNGDPKCKSYRDVMDYISLLNS